MAWLLVGSIPGTLIGSQLTIGLPDRLLRIAFAIILCLSGFKLLQVLPTNTTNWVVAVGLGVSTAALVWWEVAKYRKRAAARREQVPDAPAEPAP
jgi:hypothetical protein